MTLFQPFLNGVLRRGEEKGKAKAAAVEKRKKEKECEANPRGKPPQT